MPTFATLFFHFFFFFFVNCHLYLLKVDRCDDMSMAADEDDIFFVPGWIGSPSRFIFEGGGRESEMSLTPRLICEISALFSFFFFFLRTNEFFWTAYLQ